MKKNLLVLFLMLALCLAVAVPAGAAETSYVIDELELLTSDEIDTLNSYADSWANTLQVDICFVFTTAEDMEAYVAQNELGKFDNDIIMVENETHWEIVSDLDCITEDLEYEIRDVYDVEETYFDGIKAYIDAVAKVVEENQKVPEEEPSTPEAEPSVPEEEPNAPAEPEKEPSSVLMDHAGLLTQAEATALKARLEAIADRFSVEVAIVTVDSCNGMDREKYAKELYKESGYGRGQDKDGILLVIEMDAANRGWAIYCKALGDVALSESHREQLGEDMTPDLKAGRFADAFNTFADRCEERIDIAINGEPFDPGFTLLLSLGIGFLLAAIVTAVMKRQLKSVRFQHAAANYVREDSMHVTEAYEFFLYSTVEKRARPKSSSGSSGSVGSREGSSSGSF